MKKLRKFLVVSVMVLSIIAMSGLVIAPTAKASASAGDLIKMEGLSSVYYLGADGKRYVFPNSTTYFSWYKDFSGVVTIPASELQSYALGGNVTMRPGTKLVKITTDPSVYAVEPNGVLRKIQSEAQAASLYGTNWNKRVVDVPDAFFTNYTIGQALPSGNFPIGSLLQTTGTANVYYYDGTDYRLITSEAALNANRFDTANILTTSTAITASGTQISAAETALINVAQNGGSGNPANTGSGVMVSLASDTPAAMTVPSSATKVPFTKVNFTASNDGDTVINGIIVKRTGVGAASDLAKVYLYDGNTRLGSGRTINASTNEATFTNLGLVISKGTTKTLTITADISAGSGTPPAGVTGNHALGIAAASAITTGGANVSGSFPVTGNIMSLSATSVGKVDVESNGSSYNRKVGETGVELANFTVYVNSTEDGSFKSVTLYNTSRDVINNLKLYRGSDLVATGVKNGSYFTFVLDTPYSIEKGQSASFTVKGDVSGRNGDTAVLEVRYNTDVVVVGKTYGYNLAIDATLGGDGNSYIEEADSAPQKNTINVQAGQLTAAFVGPNTGNVPKNTNNVELLNFNLTSQASVDVSKFTVTLTTANTAAADVQNLDLVIDGVTIATIAAPTLSGDNIYTDTFTLPAGKTVTGKVLIDITSSASGNETLQAAIKDMTSTANFVAKTSDGDTVSDIIPSGNMTGKVQSVTAASLTLNRASSPASAISYVKGSVNVPVAGFAMTAGTASDVKVTSVKLTAYLDAASAFAFDGGNDKNESSGAKNVISTVAIYDGETLLGTKKALSIGTSDITVTFDGLNLVIPKGTTKNIVAKVDTANNLNGNVDNGIALTIAAAGDVVAEYGTGTNLGASLTTNNNNPTIYQIITTGGTLTVGLAADTPLKSMVLAGATNVPYTKAKFTSTKEAFIVDKLRVVNSANDSNFTDIVISYKNQAGTTVTKTQTLVAGNADFNALDIYVPKDDSVYVTVYGDMNTVAAGATNGNASTLTVSHDTNFEAYGQSSGDQITTNASGADATGASMALYEAVPTVTYASNTPSGTLIPSTNTHVARINIANAGSKDITLASAQSNQMVINIAATGAGLAADDDVVTVKDKNGNTLCSDTISLGTDTGITCLFNTNPLTIGANSTEYVDVYVDTTELSVQGNTVQTSLSDSSANNFKWGLNNVGNFATGDINFRGTLYGGSLVKP